MVSGQWSVVTAEMVVFSKLEYRLVDGNPCSVLHPWTDSCFRNAASMCLRALFGSAKFWLIIYLPGLLLRRDFSPETLSEQLIIYFRSCLMGSFCASVSFYSICVLRWILGRHVPCTLGFLPGFIGGAGIFFEHHSRRKTNLTIFIALILDLYLRLFEERGSITLSAPLQCAIFTTSSTLLLYCLRTIKGSYANLWPFLPSRLADDPELRKRCHHKGSCLENTKKAGSTYFWIALALQTLKITSQHFSSIFDKPTAFMKVLFSLRTLRLPVFAGLYISLLKGISCSLIKYRGRDEEWHILVAGMVASFTYLIQPNLSLSLLALSNLSQVLCREWGRRAGVRRGPWGELVFMVTIGLMYQARAMTPQCFPRYGLTVMDTISQGRAKAVYDMVEKHILVRS